MTPRLIQYSDVEGAFDRPERVGRLAGTLIDLDGPDAAVVGTGDDTGPGALALERRGRQTLPFFERVEPAAETFGNHDFDHSLDDLCEVVEQSAVPWVSANVRHDGEPFAGVDPARVIERDGQRVALVGVCDPALPLPPEIEVGDPLDAVRETAGDLRADWLVVLAHTTDSTARALASETAADAVLAGHVHDVVRERVDGTLLVRPGENGDVVWEVTLGAGAGDVTGDDRAVSATRHDAAEGSLDERAAADLREQLADTGLDEVVATVERPIPRDRDACLRGEGAMANLVTDALRWRADADLAHVDARGLRDGPPIGPEVTAADLAGLVPFEAGVFVATVSTADVLALVEESVHPDGRGTREHEVWTGQFAGIDIVRDPEAGETRVSRDGRHLGTVAADGSCRIVSNREFRLATNGYVVYVDEFGALDLTDAREFHGVQCDAPVEYARAVDLEAGRDGRIEFVGE